ncbi:MAG: diguanylate cyclase [Terracidiphilus sp.]
MPKLNPPLSFGEPDPTLLQIPAPINLICLIAVAIVAGLTLFAWFFPPLDTFLPGVWRLMAAESAAGLLLATLSFELSESHYSLRTHRLSQLLAILTALLGTVILAEYGFHISVGLEHFFPFDPHSTSPWPDRPSPQTATGLALLGITLALIRVRSRIAVRIADLFAICLGLLVLALVSGQIFGAMRIYGISPITRTSPQTLVCLALLTFIAFLRRAEIGVFSIFLGRGIGARIARTLGPFALVLSFLRETGRARLLMTLHMPSHYANAILVSISTAVAFALLMFLTWRINSMEKEIHDLTLRDELTGLYNLRGFTLLAEQAIRIARRSQLPLSVLFVDQDNLKEINDSLGHATGSAALAETAALLKQTFRETDVTGRVGGDEFAVVCQCSHVDISIAAQRLEAASIASNSKAGRSFPFSFCTGYATMQEHGKQSLKDLLTLADQAMYEEKKRKNLKRK